jgi:hypothetical protein
MSTPLRSLIAALATVAMALAGGVTLSATASAQPNEEIGTEQEAPAEQQAPAAPEDTAAQADPAVQEIPTEPGTYVEVGWRQLGTADRITLVGTNQPAEASIPVPPGLAPTTLTGVITAVTDVVSGSVDVIDRRGIVLGTVAVPADAAVVPFAVDIAAADVTDGETKLSFALRDREPAAENRCGRLPSLTLQHLTTGYSGVVTHPAVVADFLPRYVDGLHIWVGPDPTADEQQAALTLVAELTNRYRPLPVRVSVDTAPEPPAAVEGMSRLIEIRDDLSPGLTVRDPGLPSARLIISGTGTSLAEQVELFVDRRSDLAQSPTASVTSAANRVPEAATTLTFAQLEMSGTTSFLGTTNLYTGFDSSAFAVGSIDKARMNLRAHYTPVTSGEASVIVRAGSTVLASRPLNDSGLLELSVDVPADAIASNVGLAFDLRYISERQCPMGNDRIMFTLDPQSTVTVTPGRTNRGGIPILPMALTPQFDVALADGGYVGYAARAINLLGQQSSITLQPRLRPLEEVTDSGSGLLIVAPADRIAALGGEAAVSLGNGTSVTVNGSPVTQVDFNGPIGVIEAFSAGNRSVLAITAAEDWALVDRSFDYIDGLENRWASLHGDVVATGAAGRTVNLTVREGGVMAPVPTPSRPWMWWIWTAVAAAAGTAVGVSATALLRRRRRQGS